MAQIVAMDALFSTGAVVKGSDTGVDLVEERVKAETEEEALARRRREREEQFGTYKSLRDQLAEKKEKEDAEYAERHKLGLPPQGLEEEDLVFLQEKVCL